MMDKQSRNSDQVECSGTTDTGELDALLDRMLEKRRALASSVDGVRDFAEVSRDPYFAELLALRAGRAAN